MSQPFYQESSLLARRKQSASYLQQLELPSLPPLSQMLTDGTEAVDTKANITQDALPGKSASSNDAVLPSTTLMPPAQPVLFDYSLPTTAMGTTTVPVAPELFPTSTTTTLMDPAFLSMDAFSGMTTDPATVAAMVAAATAASTGFDGDSQQRRMRQSSESSTSSADKVFSFVPIPGTTQKKRPRRRYDEIERLYHCNWPDCTKSYGTLNHLNAHVIMQKHGPKRRPSEFKEMRKEWRRQKKEREAAKKTAEEHKRLHQEAVAVAAAAAAGPPQMASLLSGPFQVPPFQQAYQLHPTMVLSGYY